MKIVFFIHSLIGGGAERVTVNLSSELIRRGHKVIISLNNNTVEYDIDYRIEIVTMPPPKEFKGHNIFKRIYYSIYNHYLELQGTSRIIKKVSPDIIIASWGSHLWAILLSHKKIPVIASEHNTFDRHHKCSEKINRFLLNRFLSKVVVLTNYDKEFVSKYLRNTVVIPNPLTYSPISQEEYEILFPSRKNILACGRINAYHTKGFDNLIIAFSKIASKYPSWDLDIAGAGSTDKMLFLKKIAQQYGVENRVHLLGFCRNIDELMKTHSVFVLSSRSEGFGMVITEAMAMGCTCISYALTGPSEIINDGIDGTLVENQNIDKMSEALSLLMSDAVERKNQGEKALKNVLRYSVDIITDQWESLMMELVNE
ncbi:glycosyltransferase family 4 protein [uncultured Prevotella sp.]|uniref:glycosyltransferase family 4 protein n=1 Tax=uncultured Prevotella sp. TaxID=159272 RepID=UPI00258858F5|nr:glycosyltransferase family 4 protein [uncultured Prevotella sp.]